MVDANAGKFHEEALPFVLFNSVTNSKLKIHL